MRTPHSLGHHASFDNCLTFAPTTKTLLCLFIQKYLSYPQILLYYIYIIQHKTLTILGSGDRFSRRCRDSSRRAFNLDNHFSEAYGMAKGLLEIRNLFSWMTWTISPKDGFM